VVGLAVVAGVWFGRGSPQPTPVVAAAPSPATTVAADTVVVHVAGAVAEPGLVTVGAGARVADVVAAAGGALAGARLADLNLAAPVRSGDRIVVPIGGGEAAGSPPAPEPDDGRIRLNTATADELEGLPGVGPVLAQRIAAHRDANGPFRVVEDLLDVPGIGEGKLAALRDAVVVP
jgi:competence protein ComEA